MYHGESSDVLRRYGGMDVRVDEGRENGGGVEVKLAVAAMAAEGRCDAAGDPPHGLLLLAVGSKAGIELRLRHVVRRRIICR